MVIVWARTKEDAERFKREQCLGGGVIVAGNHMSRSLEGVRPTAVIQLDGAGEGEDGKRLRMVLNSSIQRSRNPVPWIDLRGKLA